MSKARQPAREASPTSKRLSAVLGSARARMKVLLPLGIATILMLLSFFLIWQASLVYRESDSLQAADEARKNAVAAMGAAIAQSNKHAEEILQSPPVISALGTAIPRDWRRLPRRCIWHGRNCSKSPCMTSACR
jgi:hypothetical protein